MMTGENKFVFVVPMWNASKTLPQMLHSIVGQSYDNWRIVLIDDVSDEAERLLCEKTINLFKVLISDQHLQNKTSVPREKFTVTWNDEKKWETANVLHGISLCEDEDIVCRIDGDDWLTDLDALAMLNAAYAQFGVDCLWTNHRWGFSDKNISAAMPADVDVDVYAHPWVSSHLKTFRKRLINDVSDENFRGEDGQYIKRCGDQAIFLPVLHNSRKRLHVPRCLYHYTIQDVPETYQTDDAKFQRDEALFLRKRGFVK